MELTFFHPTKDDFNIYQKNNENTYETSFACINPILLPPLSGVVFLSNFPVNNPLYNIIKG